ncbi:MAG: collagen-binding domain-containing protein, partial [Oscillospiraceae bacterium]
MAMDKSKKKALIKSVAAFTFAVSMFAAQSPTASAADIDNAGMVGSQISQNNDEDDDADEASLDTSDGNDDDTKGIKTSESVVPVVSDDLTNTNGTVIGDTYRESGFYNENAELGIANGFHVFTDGTLEVGVHCNGNFAAENVNIDSNFGTNGLYTEDIMYSESFGGTNRTNTGSTIILGSGHDVQPNEANPNGCIVTTPDGKTTTSLQNDKSNVFIEKEDEKYIDLKAEMENYEKLSDYLAGAEQTLDAENGDYDFSDGNSAYIVMTDENGLNVINVKASEIMNLAKLTIKNLVKGESVQTLLINVDGEGNDIIINGQIKVEYSDGTERNNHETIDFSDSRILWNFFNSESVTANNIFSGCVLAPGEDVKFNANFDGNVIASNVSINGESHRWDFNGELNLPEGILDNNGSDSDSGDEGGSDSDSGDEGGSDSDSGDE